MIKIKFVDIKHLENPQLWKDVCFVSSKCNFNTFGLTTLMCPAIKQIIQTKGIVYLFDKHYAVLTCQPKEESAINAACNECKFRVR